MRFLLLLERSVDEQLFDILERVDQAFQEPLLPSLDRPAEHQADFIGFFPYGRFPQTQVFHRGVDVLAVHLVQVRIEDEEGQSMGMPEEMQCRDERGGLAEVAETRWRRGALPPPERTQAVGQRNVGYVSRGGGRGERGGGGRQRGWRSRVE